MYSQVIRTAVVIRPLKFGALDLPSSDTIKFFSLERDDAPVEVMQGGVVMDFPKWPAHPAFGLRPRWRLGDVQSVGVYQPRLWLFSTC
jgi:hypothetical protein